MAAVTRARGVARAGIIAAALVVVPIGLVVLTAPPAAADVPIGSVCNTTTDGTTITLNADCETTEALTIPDGFTLNGGGNTITAYDPDPSTGDTYTGAVVTNAAGATTMNIENLTITGPDGGFPFILPQNSCNSPFPGLFGIYFNDASGSVNNVEVRNMFQTNTAPGSPACGVGHGIRADGVTAARTVTITDTEVSNFQKSGLFASGNDDDERVGEHHRATVVRAVLDRPEQRDLDQHQHQLEPPGRGRGHDDRQHHHRRQLTARPVQRILPATHQRPCCCSDPTT